jgi:hypothetical protein
MFTTWLLIIIITGAPQNNGLRPVEKVQSIEFSSEKTCNNAIEMLVDKSRLAGVICSCVPK